MNLLWTLAAAVVHTQLEVLPQRKEKSVVESNRNSVNQLPLSRNVSLCSHTVISRELVCREHCG